VKYRLKEEARAKGIITPKFKRSRLGTLDGRSRKTGSSIIMGQVLLNDKELLVNNPETVALRWDRVKTLLILIVILMIDTVVEGNDRMPSWFGITRCSPLFWTVFMGFIIFCLIFSHISYNKIREDEDKRVFIGNSEEFRIGSAKTAEKIYKILFVCLLGGVISGMLGVGGGLVMTPLMLELEVIPKIAASTTNFLLVFTASAGSFLFILSKQLIWDYAVVYAILCGTASLVGSVYISDYVKRTNKMSILVYALFYLMIASLVILPINGIKHAVYDISSGFNIFEFGSFCQNQ
jgi:uncharacterized membrane protein YfcA